MTSGISIIYNGQDVFFPQPVPFISLEEKNIYYSEVWAKEEQMTLEGQLTGCTFDKIFDAQNTLLNNFNKNYQSLELWQFKYGVSGKIFQKDLVDIQTIEFQQSKWLGVLGYTISLTSYPSGYFSGFFGVINPVDTWDYQERENYTLDATHSISCQGINTSTIQTNALQNAKNWVYGKTGVNISTPTPNFIKNSVPAGFLLLSINENINRINGTYSISEKYTNDLTRSGYGVIRYSTSISSGNNLLTVSLNGSVEGANRDIVAARQAFNTISPLAVSAFSYKSLFNEVDLNPNALSQSITEDAYTATINFNYIFNNDDSPDIVFDYNVKLNSGSNITAQIDGTIIARSGDLTNRFIRAQQYAQTLDLYKLTIPFYNSFYPYSNVAPLNPKPVSSGTSYTPNEGTVTLNAVFTNQDQIDNSLDSFIYTINITPSINKIDIKPKLDGTIGAAGDLYSLVDLNYRGRASLAINGTAIINQSYNSSDGVDAIKKKCLAILFSNTTLKNVTLDQKQITFDRYDDRQVSFSVSWSFESPNAVAATPYTNVNTLAII